MPGTNSFYPYGESSTNILNNSEYQTDSERSSGAQSGAIARSKMYNKQARQAAAGAYAVGALVAKSGKNADDSSAATLAANFQAAVNYQAAHFVASAVSVSGTTATATVAELATTAAADLPALFALSLVLDQALPAGASIAIASSLPDVTLSWPIYVGSEVLDSDTITGGAITLLIDTVGAKAFFKAGGGRYKPTDLPPLNPNFTMEITEGDTEDTVTVTADKLVISPTTDMLAGGQWEYGTEMSPAPGEGQNIKHWTREQLVTSGKPFDGLYLGDVTASDAVNETVLWLPENQSGETVLVPFIVLSTDYLGGVYLRRKNATVSLKGQSTYPDSETDVWCEATYLNSVLDNSVVSAILSVDIQTDGTSINRKCFILSATEYDSSKGSDGTAMPYFSTAANRITRNDSGTAVGIWTRTRQENFTVYVVNTGGAVTGQYILTNNQSYACPAFVLPKDFQIQQRPDGSYTVYNDYGLMTLKDIQASTSKNKVVVNVEETSGPSRYIYHTKNYNETKRALLERENLPTLSTAITTSYESGLATVVTQWCQSNLGSAVQSLVSDVSMTVQTWDGSLIKSSIEQSYFLLSVSEYGTDIGTGATLPYYSSSTSAPNKIKKYNGSAYKYWLRDLHSFTTASRWYQYRIDTDGAIDYDNGNTSYGYAPAFTLPLTAPIRLLADGTYDLVPEDPALSAQSISTMAEVRSDTTVTLADIPVSSASVKTIVKIPETDGSEHEYLYLSSDYEGTGRALLRRLVALDTTGNPDSNYAKNGTLKGVIDSWIDEAFPDWVSQNIASITVPYSYRPAGTSAASGTLGSFEARAFPLSGKEIGGGGIQVDTGDPLPYFSNDSRRIVNGSSGSAVNYWTRDYYGYGTHDGFRDYYVNTNGQPAAAMSGDFNAVPAITLPLSMFAIANDDGTFSLTEDTGPTVSFSFTVPHGQQPVVRQYTYNYEEHYQTMLEGGVLPPLVDEGPTYSEVLSENTWAQIAQACADNDPILDVWQIGDTKDEVIAGETLTFGIMGKNMDDLADGSGKAKLTFGMTQLMASTRQMNSSNTNAGSFAGSAMYSWLSGTIYPNLPTELKDAIKAVNKKTSSGGGSSSIRTDAMYLWLFSEIEVFGSTTYSYAGEGTQYPYFATSAERIKRLSNGSGAASYWWERSPLRGGSNSFCSVDTSGSASFYNAYFSRGVCFGFCI